MGDLLQAIQNTPVPTILIVVGLFILVLGFVTKIGGVIEVSSEQKRWTIPIGLLVLCIGLVLYLSPESSVSSPTSTEQSPESTQPPAPTQAPKANQPAPPPTQASSELQPPPGIDQQRWQQCRSVQQVLPAAEAGPNASGKQVNAAGEVRIPPVDLDGVWNDLMCWDIPRIYDW